jgi:putative ABC transport system permease protein
MIGSIFLIHNSFTISLNERTRQFGMFSSVGATARQLRNSVLFEGLCIGAVGIPIGAIVGIGSIGLALPLVARNFENILYSTVPLTLSVSVPAIVAAAAVSMVTILISAYIPAQKAAGAPVMESIRQTKEVKINAKAIKTSKLAGHIYGLERTLALKNFKRNKKRYRSIVLSLTLSVTLFVSASAFGMYLKQIAEMCVVDVDYDICFSTQDMEEKEMFQLYDAQGNHPRRSQPFLWWLRPIS